MKNDPRKSVHFPDALPIKVDHMVENEIADWCHAHSPGLWDMTFDYENGEMFIFLPTERLSVLAKLTWGGAA